MRFGERCEEQADRLREETLNLKRALDRLSVTARSAAKRQQTLEEVYAAVNEVRRAEEAVDLAGLDLRTARGEDA